MKRALFAVLGLELLLLATVPAEALVARAAGRDVILATRPVDPYDLLAGWYATLEYEIEAPPPELLPPALEEGERLWLVIERAEPAWRLVAVTRERPRDGAERTSLPARVRRGRPELEALSRFYVPEAQRHDASAATRRPALVHARVGPGGTAAMLRLQVGERLFGA